MSNFLFSGRKFVIFLHITLWLTFFLVPTYLLYIDSESDHFLMLWSFEQIFLYAVIFYANYLWLTPRYFFRKKKVLYFVLMLSLVVLATLVNEQVFKPSRDPHPHPQPGMLLRPGNLEPNFPEQIPPPRGDRRPANNGPIYNFLITTLFISGFGMGLCFSDKLRKNEKEKKEAEKEKLNTELAFLKNQINPHFFFNTLNNIYALVQTNVSDGQKAILQLSKLMRYLLYETEKGDKLLSEEIEFMKTYIELMKLRISDKVSLSIQFPEKYNDFLLPPLLFLPFIENAFKHGISYRRPSFIDVSLTVEGSELLFLCSNSIGSPIENTLSSEAGIGLENVRKRLKLLFPANHILKISEKDHVYTAMLQIQLAN